MADNENAEEEVAPSGGGGSKLILVVLVLNLAIGGGIAYLAFLKPDPEVTVKMEAPEPPPPTAAEVGPLYEVSGLVANLGGGAQGHYVKVTAHLETDSEESKALVQKAEMPIRSALLLYLSSLSPEAAVGAENISAAAEETKTRVNEVLGSELINNVYFSEFVVQ